MLGIVLGGSSCVGKTTVSRQLQSELGLSHVETDRTLPPHPEIQPLAGPDEIWDRPASELCNLLITAAGAATPHLMMQAEALARGDSGWILEGERVHPELVAQLEDRGIARGVFVHESTFERLYETLLTRLPGFRTLAESRQRKVAEVDRQFNQWLLTQAGLHGLRVVASQPWQTLSARIVDSLRGERGRPTRG
jgi:hypothetical protein